MKHILLGALAGLSMAGLAAADPVEGTWKTEPGDAGGWLYVTIASCGDAICGTIATGYDDKGAPDPGYEHNGKRMIWDMKVDGGGYYSGGKIWDPESDKTYSSKMALKGNTLTVKGCLIGGMFCRGQDWKRVK